MSGPETPSVEPTPASAGPGLSAPDGKTADPPPKAGFRFSAENLAALLARGDTLLSVGDVASARLYYERAADAGGGLAAVRLGETFDPRFLDRAHLRGVSGDPAMALFWYRRARDLGAADVEALLKALETKK
jgi:TPR repeat protein